MTSESVEHGSINPFNTYLLKINPLLEAMVAALLLERPDDVTAFMKTWLEREHAGMTDGSPDGYDGLGYDAAKEALRDEILATIRKVKILEGQYEEIQRTRTAREYVDANLVTKGYEMTQAKG
jgi:hypothetical protein